MRPGSDPNIDTQLRAYLTAWQEDQSSGNTIANLRIEIHQLKLNIDELTTQNSLLKIRLDRHGREIRIIKQHLELTKDGDAEDTGTHQIEDLRKALATREKELEKRDEDGRWWKRKAIGWLVAVAAWVATSAIAVAAYAITHPQAAPKDGTPSERGPR